MGVEFTIKGKRTDFDDLSSWVGANQQNAADLLRVLKLPVEPYGEISAVNLRDRCVAALVSWEVSDDREAPHTPPTVSGRVHWAGRSAGYLDRQLRALIALCDRADLAALCRGSLGWIIWS